MGVAHSGGLCTLGTTNGTRVKYRRGGGGSIAEIYSSQDAVRAQDSQVEVNTT